MSETAANFSQPDSPASPGVSVVIPFFREGANVKTVVEVTENHLKETGLSYEFVIVDDGSPDDTWTHMAEVATRNPAVRAFRLSRNFGKESAVSAGVANSRGKCVVVMDGDLQHPPSIIPEMVRRWQGGAQIVEAVKRSRGEESLPSKLFAHFFYSILQKLSGVNLRGASDFKLLDRQVVNAWLELRETHVFFRGMVAWLGFKRAQVPFDVASRVGGSSKWSYLKRFRLAMTAITALSSVMLQFVTICGLFFLLFSIVFAVFSLWMKISGHAVTGFTTVILLLLIIGSLLMISLGIIGEYLARIYDEVKARPRYFIAESRQVDRGPGQS